MSLPNNYRKIPRIVTETSCGRHKAPEGVPCFEVRMDSHEGHYWAVCNVRATKLFNGKPSSLPRKLSKEKR